MKSENANSDRLNSVSSASTSLDSHQSGQLEHYREHGWCKFAYDKQLHDWVRYVLPYAIKTLDAKENQHWWRYQSTWFVGVNVLPNDSSGAVDGGPELSCDAQRFMQNIFGFSVNQMDQAQVSTCFAGYPKAAVNESEALYSYRLNKDAAHVDGLLKEGPERHRFAREYHEYILLIPMTEVEVGAAPFVVWNGSYRHIQQALQDALALIPAAQWANTPLTNPYTEARKQALDNCQRVELNLKPGQAMLAHRMLLHGTAPWLPQVQASEHGRMLCFFRPQTLDIEQWLFNEC